MDIPSSSSLESDKSEDSEDSEGLEASEDSDALRAVEDQQHRREMDDYDKCMARAHEIAEKIRQRQESESNSELSELASSVFNGMEGIEGGGDAAIAVEDQEMGGTLTDGQTGQVMGGTGTSGDSEAQVPVFSPRKTKSGRLIK
jgi:hypothetical protein